MSISSNEFEPPPVYDLTPSRWLKRALILLPLIGLLSLLQLRWFPLPLQILALGAVVAATLLAWTIHWPGAKRSTAAVQISANGLCTFWQQDGAEKQGRVLDCLVTPWLIIITLQPCLLRRAIVIPIDALPGEGHRSLRRRVLSAQADCRAPGHRLACKS